MKVRILGSASGVPMPGRYNESALVRVGEASYLFDAGEPCAATIHNSDISIYSIKAVFISHTDADHIGGLPMLLQVAWLWQSRGPEFRFRPDNSLKLYMPSEAIPAFRQFLGAMRLAQRRMPYKLDLLPVREGATYRDETAAVSAQMTTHLTRHTVLDDEGKPCSQQAYSFVLEGEGKKVVYSGDIGAPSDIVNLCDRTDLLIVECAHFPAEKLFAALPLEKIKRVIVNHIHPSWCDDENKILGALKDSRGCEVVVARDNMEVEV